MLCLKKIKPKKGGSVGWVGGGGGGGGYCQDQDSNQQPLDSMSKIVITQPCTPLLLVASVFAFYQQAPFLLQPVP